MIDVFIGTQGSGKSLTSIHYLFQNIEIVNDEGKKIKVPRHSQYKRLITNVGGFNSDLFRELSCNFDLDIIHENKKWGKSDLEVIFSEQMKEEEKPEHERVPTLIIYDECQFALSTFSTSQANIEVCELISNFFSLMRHYGPCDVLLMTQSRDKIHSKYLGDDFNLYIALDRAKKKDPENDIVFDLYDSSGKNILPSGRSKIKYKKLDKLKDNNGNDFSPFDLYVSGDGGRKISKSKSHWHKFVYILILLLLFVVCVVSYVFYSMFDGMHKNIEKHTVDFNKSSRVVSSVSSLPASSGHRRVVNDVSDDPIFSRYIEAPYHDIDAQINFRVFVMNDVYYFGSFLMSVSGFKKMVSDNKLFVVSIQPITKDSFYVNVLIHQSLLNSFGLVKDFDKSNDKRIKSSTKVH